MVRSHSQAPKTRPIGNEKGDSEELLDARASKQSAKQRCGVCGRVRTTGVSYFSFILDTIVRSKVSFPEDFQGVVVEGPEVFAVSSQRFASL